MNLGIQAAFASNVAADSASIAPGRGSSGEAGAETFFSTYALSVSKSSANGVPLPENSLTKGKTNAKATAVTGGLTASPNSAPKKETSPITPASGAPSTITLPAATASFSSATTLATLPDLSPASSIAQRSLVAQVSASSWPQTSASHVSASQASGSPASTPQSSTPGASTLPASTTEQFVAASTLSDNQLGDDLTPTQSSNPALNPAFAEPGQVGLDPSVVAATTPVQKTASANTQNSATPASSRSSIVAPSQNVGAPPISSTSMNGMPRNVIPGSGAMPAPVSSAANSQSRRESAGPQHIASGEISNVHATPASGTGGPEIGLAAPHELESTSSKLQNGITTELFQLHFSSANTSALSSSSSASSTSIVPPVSAGIPAGAGRAGPDSSGTQTTASAEPNHSPGNINPASGAQGKDSGSSDSAAEQSGAGPSGTGQSGVQQSGDEQSFRKDLTAVATSPTAAQPVMPQLAATAIPGDTAGPPGTSPAANPAPKSGTAGVPASDSSSSSPMATGESPLPPAVGPVQMAQMVSRAAQSEMRIGLTTSAFGNVEVRTQIRANDVGLAIGSERGDLRSLLANELPGVANRLQEQSLRLSQVNFHETSAFSGGSSSGGNPGGDSQRRFFTQPAPVPPPVTETSPETFSAAGNIESSRSRHAGLSVLA
ncbi:MAG: flagellar hook-length control protein FliK [Candidatus Sulfotelmatobacter sp.]